MSPLAKLESQIDKLNSLKTPKPLNRDTYVSSNSFRSPDRREHHRGAARVNFHSNS